MNFLNRHLQHLKTVRKPQRHRKRGTEKPTVYQSLEKRNLLAAFTVNTASDVVDLNDGLVSLREAITAANTNVAFGDATAGDVDGDFIRFDSSLSGTTILLNGDDLPITDDLNMRGDVTIDAGRSSRIFTIESSEVVRLADLLFVNGIADNGGAISFEGGGTLSLFSVDVSDSNTIGGTDGSGSGGGVFVFGGNLYMSGSNLSNNRSTTGGAVFVEDGRANIRQSSLVNNGARDGGALAVIDGEFYSSANSFVNGIALNNGGAIFLAQTASTAVIASTSFAGNFSSQSGGAISLETDAQLLITNNSRFSSNQSHDGGAISNLGSLQVRDTQFTANTSRTDGGAISSYEADLRIVDSDFRRSRAHQFGGAVFNHDSTATILRSSFFSNRAYEEAQSPNQVAPSPIAAGGAIYSDISEVFIGASTIENNTGRVAGGGIVGNQGRTRIYQTAITGNTSPDTTTDLSRVGGGGIQHTGGTLLVSDSTISKNRSLKFDGGGIATSNAITNVINSTVSENVAKGNSGAGFAFSSGSALLLNSTFSGNIAYSVSGSGSGINGGAVLAGGPVTTDGPASLTVVGGLFEDNQSSGSGGAIFVRDAVLRIRPTVAGEGTVFSNNRALPSSTTGGAISLSISEDIERSLIDGAEFDSNYSSEGGAIYAAQAQLTVTDSLFSNNRASDRGGAISLTASDLFKRDNIFENNTSPQGRDIFDNSTVSFPGFIGQTLQDASELAGSLDRPWRVSVLEGEPLVLTQDYRPERLNFEVNDGLVTDVSTG